LSSWRRSTEGLGVLASAPGFSASLLQSCLAGRHDEDRDGQPSVRRRRPSWSQAVRASCT